MTYCRLPQTVAACLLLIAFLPSSSSAQEQLGMRLERRAGSYSLALNPANAAFNPDGWDVSLFSADLFGNQNYAFVRDAKLGTVLRHPDRLVSIDDISPENPAAPDALVVEFFGENKGRAFGVVQTRVTGPGFTARLADRHTIGLSLSGRAQTSCYRLPTTLRYEPAQNIKYGQPVLTNPVRIGALAWSELALHYGYRQGGDDGGLAWAFGVSPKLLLGAQGGYAEVDDQFEYTRLAKDTVQFRTGDWAYAFTNDILYAADPQSVKPRFNGRGVGLDLGFSWAMPADDGDFEDYRWRAGVSLLDLGAVRFRQNAERHLLRFDTTLVVDVAAIQGAADPEATVAELSQAFLLDSTRSLQGRSFSVGLPTALSAQFDVALNQYFYVGAVWVQRAPLLKHSLRRPSTLAVAPRFEHRWGSVTVPLVLSDYRSLRVGVAARLAWLTVGTDDLNSWVGKKQLTGGDIYIGLKINGFYFSPQEKQRGKRHKKERNWGGLRNKDRHWREVGCSAL